MPSMTSGTALRHLHQAQQGLRKARQLMKNARENPGMHTAVFRAGWMSLSDAHRLMALIPLEAVDDAVMTRQLNVERYCTALLVRLRRLQRQGKIDPDDLADDDKFDDADEELED
jgi:hypothetical protein